MNDLGYPNVYSLQNSNTSSRSFRGLNYNQINPEEFQSEISSRSGGSVIDYYCAGPSESLVGVSDQLPPKIKQNYSLLEELPSSGHFKEYKVRSLKNHMLYNLRIISLKSTAPKDDKENTPVTTFIKELVRFCMLQPSEIILEDIEEGNGVIAYVKKPSHSLKSEGKDAAALDIKKVINDVLTDVNFLQNRMQLGPIPVKLANIFQSESNTYYIDYWRATTESSKPQSTDSQIGSLKIGVSDLSSAKLEAQIYQLGLAMIQIKSEDPTYLERCSQIIDSKIHDTAFRGILSSLDYSKDTKDLLREMVQRDPKNRIKLEQLIVVNDSFYVPQIQPQKPLNPLSDLKMLSSEYILQPTLPKKIKGYPETAHGVIIKAHKEGSAQIGTGVLIGPSIVLTSFNNIFDQRTSSYYELLEFIPGMNRHADPPFGKVAVKKYFAYQKLQESQERGDGFGILVLERPVGEETGYFGLHVCDEKKGLPKDLKLMMGGYYKDLGKDEKIQNALHKMEGELVGVDTNGSSMWYKLTNKHDGDGLKEGLGGAGVYYRAENGACYVIGVHHSYIKEHEVRSGHWIRFRDLKVIKGWIKEYGLQELEVESSDSNTGFVRTRALGY